MPELRVLLIDSDPDSASWLVDELHRQGIVHVLHMVPGLELAQVVAHEQPDAVLFNHHFDRPDDLLACYCVRAAAPASPIVAVAAAGPTVRELRQWAARTGSLDAVLEKPLTPGMLQARLHELAAAAQARHALEDRARRLTNLVPEGALSMLEGEQGAEEEMFEAAVLFTDVRRSSDLVTSVAPRAYFRMLDRLLSAQAAQVRRFKGSVVKYTGDGLMAVFRGMGRTHLALRCAAELACDPAQQLHPYGVGVAEGLVLAGLVGASGDHGNRSQYDVIGATAHLAARLCGMAGPGEVVATRSAHLASRLEWPQLRLDLAVQVRGFPAPVDCVVYAPGPALSVA